MIINRLFFERALLCFVLVIFGSFDILALPKIQNLPQMIQASGFAPYYQRMGSLKTYPGKRLKIAILDNGFSGYQNEIGKGLPEDTSVEFVAGPLAPPEPQEVHGLAMAKIVSELITNRNPSAPWRPKLFLFNTFGYTNLKNAIDQSLAEQVDIILYSQVWEYGGNNDGRGFINSLVNKALESGILWINAAGDFGSTTFNSPIQIGKDEWLKFPGPNSSVTIECRPKTKDKAPPISVQSKCPIRVVASWNDFAESPETGTSKDLDLFLFDDTLNLIEQSSLQQNPNPPSNEPGFSKYPREILESSITPGTYYLRMKYRSGTFGKADKIRITAAGMDLTMPQHDRNESILNPADNPKVITVAGTEPKENSRSKLLGKPDLIAFSSLQFETNASQTTTAEESSVLTSAGGSSIGAAVATAGIALLRGIYPKISKKEIVNIYKNQQRTSLNNNGSTALSLAELQFNPLLGSSCFMPIDSSRIPQLLYPLIQAGGTPVDTTAGVKLLFSTDPFAMNPSWQRIQRNDILVISQNGYALYPRSMMWQLGPAFVELLQIPYGQFICGQSPSTQQRPPNEVKVFRLPRL